MSFLSMLQAISIIDVFNNAIIGSVSAKFKKKLSVSLNIR
jgi:hypothetical protein